MALALLCLCWRVLFQTRGALLPHKVVVARICSGGALQAICAQRFAQGQEEDVSSNLCVDERLGINAPRICAGAGRDRVQQFGVDAVKGRRTYISKYQISLFEQ